MKEREGQILMPCATQCCRAIHKKIGQPSLIYRCAFLPLPSKLRCNKSRCKQRANKIASIA